MFLYLKNFEQWRVYAVNAAGPVNIVKRETGRLHRPLMRKAPNATVVLKTRRTLTLYVRMHVLEHAETDFEKFNPRRDQQLLQK